MSFAPPLWLHAILWPPVILGGALAMARDMGNPALIAQALNFQGLNLMFETREGILKHCSARNARQLGALGKRFLERRQPGLEAQLVNIADAIAYNNHDVDDGLTSGMFSVSQIRDVRLFREGEGRANETTVWVQPPGTPSIGMAFLDAYEATGDPTYLEAARRAGRRAGAAPRGSPRRRCSRPGSGSRRHW